MPATLAPPPAARATPAAPPADDPRWAAVAGRDRSADGRFVYAVRTTGIYCRPSCPSRRPNPANVSFHADAVTAELAGFRACRRCRPERDGEAPRSEGALAVERARAWLDARPERRVTLAELAAAVGVSAPHLQRTFTRAIGVSPRRYQAALRAERFRATLRHEATVSGAGYAAGYEASSRAYDAAAAHLGMSPGAYRGGGRGVVVRYLCAPTAVGTVLVAASARGLCAVTLGDACDALEAALAAELPAAVRTRVAVESLAADDPLLGWLAAVRAQLDGGTAPLAGPLDVPGTALQRRVWETLRTIPPGETRSYGALAAASGTPHAVRAVASACARNRLALVIPCHRAVRADGTAGEYRWGAERKRTLLARESAIAVRRLAAAGDEREP